jgi:hypothetical protein
MKKSSFFIIAVMAITFSANAQTIGATLGANIANVAGDDIVQSDSKFNFTAGLFAEFPLTEKIGIQPEFIFSGQGYKFMADDGAGLNVEWKQKLTYVNIPVLVNYYVAENFYLQAGPYLGFLTNAELNVSGTLGILGGDNQEDFQGTDFGVAIGAGFKVNKVNLGLRYQMGMSDIETDGSLKNRVLNVYLGYRFVEQ